MAHVFTAAEKATIALEAVKGVETLAQIASTHQAHPIQVGLWKKKLSENAHTIFDTEQSESKRIKALEQQNDDLFRIIGQRDAELVWLQKKFGS